MKLLSGRMPKVCVRTQRLAVSLLKDRSGVVAIEFAIVVPVMLLLFFGTVEFSSAIAIKRKVTTMARTVSDLTSQAAVINSTDMTNFFAASLGIMTPYAPGPTNTTVSELYIDSSGNARVQWSVGSSPRGVGTPVAGFPSGLVSRDSTGKVVTGQYLIFSEVNYLYSPPVDYIMRTNVAITLSDVAYTRPRQTTCVFYPSTPTPAVCPTTTAPP
jgi:Flp pilus assembly protein TadG